MKDQINPNSPLPLYYQVKERITEGINEGKWRAGDMIPSENQISAMFNVSRNTAQRALDELVKEGILIRKQGVGSFVTEPRIEPIVSQFYSFSDAVTASGYRSSNRVLGMKIVEAAEAQAKELRVSLNTPLYALTRLRLANDMPFVLETSYLPVQLMPGLERFEFEKVSLYKTMANQYSIYVTKAREVFEPILLSKSESKLLEVAEGSPALLLERTAYNTEGDPVEFCTSVIPGNKCRFYANLK